MQRWSACLAIAAGLLGAAGVGAAAAAAHGPFPPTLMTAATFMLLHAAAVLAISRMPGRSRYWLGCGALLAIGAILFGGELTLSALTGHSPSPIAAPAGGWAMILGWLGVALGGGRELFTAS